MGVNRTRPIQKDDPNESRTERDRSRKKLIQLNRRLDRWRPVNTMKRKSTETETGRSKPARKGSDSVKHDQPIPIRPNTNPIGSRSNRKPIGQESSRKKSRLMKTRKRPVKDTTTDDMGSKRHYKREQRIWWIVCRQWFGWNEWMYSKWRDKVHIAGETEAEGEITSTGNFGTYRRMCGFGGGECRSVIRTLREKC